MSAAQGQFCEELVWSAVADLLRGQLNGVDVKEITDRDFNERGELVMYPPSVRVLFAGTRASSTSDTQRLSYNAVANVMALCADVNERGVIDQAVASLQLASRVKAIAIGARIVLPTGDVSEPVTWIGTEPMPVPDLGTAYAVAFEVPGLAQFDGPNAWPGGVSNE